MNEKMISVEEALIVLRNVTRYNPARVYALDRVEAELDALRKELERINADRAHYIALLAETIRQRDAAEERERRLRAQVKVYELVAEAVEETMSDFFVGCGKARPAKGWLRDIFKERFDAEGITIEKVAAALTPTPAKTEPPEPKIIDAYCCRLDSTCAEHKPKTEPCECQSLGGGHDGCWKCCQTKTEPCLDLACLRATGYRHRIDECQPPSDAKEPS